MLSGIANTATSLAEPPWKSSPQRAAFPIHWKRGVQALSVFCSEALSASRPADTTANAAET